MLYGVAIVLVRATAMHSGYVKKFMKPEKPRNYNTWDSNDTASVTIGRSEIGEDIANPDVCVSGLLAAHTHCQNFFQQMSEKAHTGCHCRQNMTDKYH